MTTTWRRRLAVAALPLLVPALAACGFDRATEAVYTPGVGTNDRSAAVNVLHGVIVTEDGGTGVLIAGLVNKDLQEADGLVSVAGADRDTDLEAQLTADVSIGPDSLVQLNDVGGVLVEGERVQPGNFVTVVFTFENSDPVTLAVPVVARRGDFAGVEIPTVEQPELDLEVPGLDTDGTQTGDLGEAGTGEADGETTDETTGTTEP